MVFEFCEKNVQTYRHTEFILFLLKIRYRILSVYVCTLFLKNNKISSSWKTSCKKFAHKVISIDNQTSQNSHEMKVLKRWSISKNDFS